MADRFPTGTALAVLLGLFALTGVARTEQTLEPGLREALRAASRSTDSFDNRFDAQVWLTDMSHRLADEIPDPQTRVRFLKTLHYEARRADLEPEWVLALIEVESGFRRFAISSVGALGYMQIMPFWLKEIGRPDDNLFNVETNLRMGCTILRFYLDREEGDLTRALARYNGSVGRTWYPVRVFEALNGQWLAN